MNLQTRQPLPPQAEQVAEKSTPGSTKGKKSQRKRTRVSGPKSWRAISVSVPFRSVIVIPSSTASPSSWKKIDSCEASVAS